MITILTGVNNYLLRAELAKRVAAFTAHYGNLGVEQLDGEEAPFERMQEAAQSLPFLADKKLVVLHKPSANKQFIEKITDVLAEVQETTDLIIVEPKLDKRSAYYKLLKKQKGYQEYNELDENGLARWIINEAKQKGATISSNDARYLIERVGVNQQRLASEVEKLSLYSEQITRQAIDAMTQPVPQSTIFQLLETAFAGNTKRALELYHEQRILKVEPQQIIAMLAWQLHVLALIKTAGDRSPDAIAKEAKISPYVVKKSVSIARKLNLAETKRLVSELVTIDERLKRESLNADDVMQDYLIHLYQ